MTSSRSRHRGAACTAMLLALAVRATAAPTPEPMLVPDLPGVPWYPGHTPAGSFGPSAAGHFLSADPGLAVVRGTDLYYVHSPFDFWSISPIDTSSQYADVALEPSVSGNHDAILGSTDSGLVRASFSTGAGMFSVGFLDASSALTSCRRLICYASLAGPLRIAALSSDGGTVTVLERQSNGTYAQISSFTPLNATSWDLVAVNWEVTSPTDELELVLLANNGISVYSQAGTGSVGARSDLAGGAIAAVRSTAFGPPDRVAWLARRSSGYVFYLIDSSGWQSGEGTDLWDLRARIDPAVPPEDPTAITTEDVDTLTTPVTPIHMVSGDLDGDGDDDLVVTMEEFGRVLALRNAVDGNGRFFHPDHVFDEDSVAHVDLTTAPGDDSSFNRGRPALLDFDMRSAADLAIAVDDDESVRLLVGTLDPTTSGTLLAGTEGYVSHAWFEIDSTNQSAAPGYLYLRLANLPDADYLEGKYLQVVVWRKLDADPTHYMQAAALSNTMHALITEPEQPTPEQYLQIVLPAESFDGASCGWIASDPIQYFVTYRFVDWDGSSISNASQRWIFGHTSYRMAADCTDGHHLDYLLGRIEPESADDFQVPTDLIGGSCDNPPGSGSSFFGTIVIQTDIPEIPPYSTPNPQGPTSAVEPPALDLCGFEFNEMNQQQ